MAYSPMTARSPDELHRAATPLELFFDLCFVVAIAQAGARLVHSLAEGHPGAGVVGYFFVFFGVWWAWMNGATGRHQATGSPRAAAMPHTKTPRPRGR